MTANSRSTPQAPCHLWAVAADGMLTVQRACLLALLLPVLGMLGSSLLRSLTRERPQELGNLAAMIGMILGCYWFSGLFVCLATPDSRARRLVGASLVCHATLLLLQVIELFGGRGPPAMLPVATGAAMLGSYVTFVLFLREVATALGDEQRILESNRYLGLLALILGVTVAGLVAPGEIALLFLIAAVLLGIWAVLALAQLAEHVRETVLLHHPEA